VLKDSGGAGERATNAHYGRGTFIITGLRAEWNQSHARVGGYGPKVKEHCAKGENKGKLAFFTAYLARKEEKEGTMEPTRLRTVCRVIGLKRV